MVGNRTHKNKVITLTRAISQHVTKSFCNILKQLASHPKRTLISITMGQFYYCGTYCLKYRPIQINFLSVPTYQKYFSSNTNNTNRLLD